jgi:hypothetical protein
MATANCETSGGDDRWFGLGFEAGEFVGSQHGQNFVDARAAFEHTDAGGVAFVADGRDYGPLRTAEHVRLEAE